MLYSRFSRLISCILGKVYFDINIVLGNCSSKFVCRKSLGICEGESVPIRDTEDLLLFLMKHNLTAPIENMAVLLKLSLTLPVSSAHDERAFSCLKRAKTYT